MRSSLPYQRLRVRLSRLQSRVSLRPQHRFRPPVTRYITHLTLVTSTLTRIADNSDVGRQNRGIGARSELLRLEAQVSKLERRAEVYKKDPDQDMRADREAIMRCREDIRAYGGYLDAQSKDLRACSEEIERLRMVTSDS